MDLIFAITQLLKGLEYGLLLQVEVSGVTHPSLMQFRQANEPLLFKPNHFLALCKSSLTKYSEYLGESLKRVLVKAVESVQ